MSSLRLTMALIAILACFLAASCSAARLARGGIYRELDENLTIVKLTEKADIYLDKKVVISVRYFKKGDLPCPLGDDYVNFIIADRMSYITLNKVWIAKEKAAVLDTFKEMETVVMRARVFKVGAEKDPYLEALEILPEYPRPDPARANGH
ncbi:MAG: hypothetical protein LDL33_01560 [Desulfomonile sp.]|nr:hypothetical protein [Desulfomonile sp.]